jgi:DNA (cytosine-5)-methyltransferase 1
MAKYKFNLNDYSNLSQIEMTSILGSLNFDKGKKTKTVDIDSRGYKVNNLSIKDDDNNVQAIGLFSGAGGLDIGTQLAGAKVISSLDFDKDSVATIKANSYFSHGKHFHCDIRNINLKIYKDLITKSKPSKLILVGGPPCQPFSKAGYWVTNENRLGSDDPRNMIGQYLELIRNIKPDGFLLENVESILHPKNEEAVSDLREAIEKMGFNFIVYNANALDFGVPQKRKRVFFLCSRRPIFEMPLPTHGLPSALNQFSALKPFERVVDWIAKYDTAAFSEKEEHTKGKTYESELSRIPPGQNYFALTERSGVQNPPFMANKRFWNFLLKLHPYLPSWTIAAQPGPWVGPFHWTNRRLRAPEIAAIQTFPEDYIFHGSRRSIQKQIGNAVPPLLGREMVSHLIKHL